MVHYFIIKPQLYYLSTTQINPISTKEQRNIIQKNIKYVNYDLANGRRELFFK